MTTLTHIGASGEARMVDVSCKDETARVALAEGRVVMAAETLALILSGDAKKDPPLPSAAADQDWGRYCARRSAAGPARARRGEDKGADGR